MGLPVSLDTAQLHFSLEERYVSYILQLLPIVPGALLVAAVMYFVFRQAVLKRREKPAGIKILAEFLLVCWFVLFLYITQVKSFGNGLGELYNLKPLQPFRTAFRYGSNNAGMVWQILLNILMFVPLGFLLPMVFPRKCATWPKVLLVSFATTLATELLQLISMRGTDIDDIIANTIGGLCGFSLFLILREIRNLPKPRNALPPHRARNLAVSIAVLLATAAPFIALGFSDGVSEFGNLYYGNLQPTSVQIDASVSMEEPTRSVYRYAEAESIEALKERLMKASGFSDDFAFDGETWALSDGAHKRIFIFPYNKWSVLYTYGVDSEPDAGLVPGEEEALALAWQYLNAYGIANGQVVYAGDISNLYGDPERHLSFTSNENTDSQIVYGSIDVTIGEKGVLSGLSDSRVYCQYVKAVPCISPVQSIYIAQDVGVGEWNGVAHVSSVQEGFGFIEDTGYLIPAWELNAIFTSASGQAYDWNPVIDAIK